MDFKFIIINSKVEVHAIELNFRYQIYQTGAMNQRNVRHVAKLEISFSEIPLTDQQASN